MIRKGLVVLGLLSAAAFAGPARAEKVDMSPEELLKTATHVIVAKVAAVYERTETGPQWKYTRYLAEVKVEKAEKGDGLKAGDLVYVRYWRKGWVGGGNPPPDTSGHRGLPAVRDTVRIYLAKNAYDGFTFDNKDGGFNVIGANGFEALPQPKR